VKVKCAGCREYKEKEFCVPYGLGWCCDANCRWLAIELRRKSAPPNRTSATPKRRAQPSLERRRKMAARERDHGCRYCLVARNLHVHHIVYRSEGGTHAERNLITLCNVHHDLMHSNKKRFQPVLKELIRLHYETDQFLTVTEVERRLALAA
jgi:5-methylcytosine-specific restriction endonuclease McrA